MASVLKQRNQSVKTSSSNQTEKPKLALKRKGSYNEVHSNIHDIFNLFALVPVVVLDFLCWDWHLILNGNGGFEESWANEWYHVFLFYAIAYFVVDFLWVTFQPSCVKSPLTIQMHHLAMVILIVPFFLPRMRCLMGVGLAVEVNTWLLIFRRHLWKKKVTVSPAVTSFLSLMFYGTWIAIRVILYPMIMIIVTRISFESYMNWVPPLHSEALMACFAMVGWFCIMMLNLKWTVDLFRPMLLGNGKKKGENSDGL